MFPTTAGNSSFTVALSDEQATLKLMRDIASIIAPGDTITLSGDLGAGKTTFARALIRHFAGDPLTEVPSPTFTLTQSYDLPKFPLVHADLYRLSGSSELAELGFDDLPPTAVTLVEWPDRAAGYLPPDRLDIGFTLAPKLGPSHRNARVTGYGSFGPRIERLNALRVFLAASGLSDAERQRIQGDASTRIYERLRHEGRDLILMDAPRRPDGPPVQDGKPYSAIAHLAEDVTPFVAMARGLRERGFSAPAVLHADRDAGLLVLEDLGKEGVVRGTPPSPIPERYEAAINMLAALHGQKLPETLPVDPATTYTLPHYDLDAFLIELELLPAWYLPMLNAPLTEARRDTFLSLWRDLLQPLIDTQSTWVLRDFHSPNLMWLPQRSGIARVGLLDFQDAVIGPAAYDVASLLQDARIDVPEKLELTLLSRYLRARHDADPTFDAAAFAELYSVMAAQRATKILGIFARLDRRDHKPQYLRHIPRVWNYLQRALAHPALSGLKSWYAIGVPALKTI
ncbi:MAG: tRNA (adenosine(37)-N6)-threonylcarbamoyltransferase complex ATPase subunit type 1 TsaE [Rhizobiales bacterium]|nr:tRNA (adenosine(37)-N6)-threonylcarbamoyltransferase complex ATPase subunit type 1 TsaE [Hyphomicrobiales bacterium]OJY41160.1 MAG: tRNA (adenosine(37)-N6)-threonylcarbamoyltransferase complex ATPase subunit type 1 TsaE [Rhizobiales bacterium 64-17]